MTIFELSIRRQKPHAKTPVTWTRAGTETADLENLKRTVLYHPSERRAGAGTGPPAQIHYHTIKAYTVEKRSQLAWTLLIMSFFSELEPVVAPGRARASVRG